MLLPSSTAWADEDTAPADAEQTEMQERSFSTGTAFFDDAKVSGGLYFFARDRRRYDFDTKKYEKNLRHSTGQANAEFNSGFIGDVIGVDFGVFASTDLRNTGAVDHEMGFVPWRDPWSAKWHKKNTKDGFSIYKAHLKVKAGPAWAKAGYFQPTGPSVLGVNWSIMPGTYQGVESGVNWGGLSLAGVVVNEYKAPWYNETYNFRRQDESTIDFLWSVGAKYTFENKASVELAYGDAKDFTQIGHVKVQHPFSFDESSLTLGYHLYIMSDKDNEAGSKNNLYDGTAFQHYAFINYELDPWDFRLEGTYTIAPQDSPEQQGYFAYRLTVPNGSSKGAYSAWWDARSDWNHDQEKAVFGKISRKLDDILPVAGVTAGVGAMMGWDGQANGVAEHLREWAFTGDLQYTRQEGPLKGSSVSFHYTEYRNASHRKSWDGFHNAFQDERDFKLFLKIPFS